MTAQTAMELGGPEHKPELAQWHTPVELASQLVKWGLRCRHPRAKGPSNKMTALEPSAGGGAFVAALREHFHRVTAHELDPAWAGELRSTYPAVRVIEGDYLSAPPPHKPYGFCAMNPPYEDGQDGKHVAKAMAESMRVVALVRLAFLSGSDRYERVWSQLGTREEPGPWSLDGLYIFTNRPRFSGTKGAAKHDFCAIYLTRDEWERTGSCCPDWGRA